MKAPLCKSKANRDRIRQKVGESRKQQLAEVRKQVRRWRDGADIEACMQAIETATGKVAVQP